MNKRVLLEGLSNRGYLNFNYSWGVGRAGWPVAEDVSAPLQQGCRGREWPLAVLQWLRAIGC